MTWTQLIADERIRDTISRIVAQRGISPYRLSKLTGLNESALARYLKGKSDMTGGSLDKVCKALGLTLTEGKQ